MLTLEQKDFESFMMQYKPELRDFKKVGEFTYTNTLTSIAYDSYLAGAASRQQEVEKLQTEIESLTKDYQELTEMYIQQGKTIYELQKRIDELKDWCITGVECSMLSTTYNQALIDMLKILKGE